MAIVLSKWDAADYLHNQEDFDEHLRLAAEDGDPRLIAMAMGDIARAKKRLGLIASETGLNKAGVYRAFSAKGGNPTMDTFFKVAHALGYGISMRPLTPEQMKKFAAK